MVASLPLLLLLACFRLGPEDYAATLDADGDGYDDAAYGGDDCAPSDPDVHPGATEVCDGVDNDCDGTVDGADAEDARSWSFDYDNDGFGDDSDTLRACRAPNGYVADGGDCAPTDPDVHPGADELCNGADDDCDGDDDEDAVDAPSWRFDDDKDGYGTGEPLVQCEQPSGYADKEGDCADDDRDVHPDADELCNGIDDDCDEEVDEDATDAITLYLDGDGDGWGDEDNTLLDCEAEGYVAVGGDCDDANGTVYPEAEEICDGLDNDCDEETDFEVDVPAEHATIAAAIAAAAPGDRICVLAGTYTEQLTLSRDLSLIGQDRDSTIIDAGGGGRALSVEGVGNTGLVRSFTLTGGDAASGAGLRVLDSDAAFQDLRVTGNAATDTGACDGAAIHLDGSGATFEQLLVDGNSADCGTVNGLVSLYDASYVEIYALTLSGNTVTAREDSAHIGVLTWLGSEATLTNAVISGNHGEAPSSGGRVYGSLNAIENSILLAENLSLHGNSGSAEDILGLGVSALDGGEIYLANTSLTGHTATGQITASAVYIGPDSTLDTAWCNVWGNDGSDIYGYSLSEGTGNLEVSPGFVDVSGSDPTAWDLHLAAGSALIDAGDSRLLDADGSPSDIGAYGGPAGNW